MRILIILCFTFFQAYGQELKLFVYDTTGNELINYEVSLNKRLVEDAHVLGFVSVKLMDVLTVENEGYKSQTIKITDEILNRSFHIFILQGKVQEIDEVTVLENKKESLDYTVVDYQPTPNGLVILKKSKQKTLLNWISNDLMRDYPVELNANAIHLDALGTIHYATPDSSYQFYLNELKLEKIETLPIKDFEGKIKPIIYKNDDHLVYEKFSLDRKKYELIEVSKSEKPLFTIFDEVRYKVSMSTLRELIAYYNAHETPVANVILNNCWSGKIKDLNIDVNTNSMIAWQNIMSLPIKCTTINLLSAIYTFDFNSGFIHKFDTLFQNQEAFTIPKELSRNSDILYDYYFNIIYLLHSDRQLGEIYLFNQETDDFEYITEVSLRNHENFKVMGNNFYYLEKDESGYRHIRSVVLNENHAINK